MNLMDYLPNPLQTSICGLNSWRRVGRVLGGYSWPNLLKYLAGPEIGGGNFLSDTAPEEKAAELRALAKVHYKQREGLEIED